MEGLSSKIGGVTGAEDANQLVFPETKTQLQGGHKKVVIATGSYPLLVLLNVTLFRVTASW